MATKRKSPPKRNDDNVVLSVSMPKKLKALIKQAAEEDRRSISNYLVMQLEEFVKAHKAAKKNSDSPLS